ncbi:hypothetical protein RND81_01G022700 [Saponaria officinalis]|uniref:Uncharacterized protein n=1 Tax=Saponaria officinalis TaxID=3572 RepID=A0AAW1NBC6_SAPOF
MISTKSPPSSSPQIHHSIHSKLEFRKPLQPKNTIPSKTPISNPLKKPQNNASITMYPPNYAHSNKENLCIFSNSIEIIDPSLAEELSAVKLKLERLRLDKEKTEKMLDDRRKLIDFRIYELQERGEFQRELEIEVDRLFRLKQLKLTCTSMSPIKSLREKTLDKKKCHVQFESAKSEDSKEKLADEISSSESSSMSLECSWTSTSASTSAPASTTSSTATSKMSKLSIGSASDKCKI